MSKYAEILSQHFCDVAAMGLRAYSLYEIKRAVEEFNAVFQVLKDMAQHEPPMTQAEQERYQVLKTDYDRDISVKFDMSGVQRFPLGDNDEFFPRDEAEHKAHLERLLTELEPLELRFLRQQGIPKSNFSIKADITPVYEISGNYTDDRVLRTHDEFGPQNADQTRYRALVDSYERDSAIEFENGYQAEPLGRFDNFFPREQTSHRRHLESMKVEMDALEEKIVNELGEDGLKRGSLVVSVVNDAESSFGREEYLGAILYGNGFYKTNVFHNAQGPTFKSNFQTSLNDSRDIKENIKGLLVQAIRLRCNHAFFEHWETALDRLGLPENVLTDYLLMTAAEGHQKFTIDDLEAGVAEHGRIVQRLKETHPAWQGKSGAEIVTVRAKSMREEEGRERAGENEFLVLGVKHGNKVSWKEALEYSPYSGGYRNLTSIWEVGDEEFQYDPYYSDPVNDSRAAQEVIAKFIEAETRHNSAMYADWREAFDGLHPHAP